MFVKCSDFGSTKIRCLLSHSLSLLVLIFTLIFSQKEFGSPSPLFYHFAFLSRFNLLICMFWALVYGGYGAKIWILSSSSGNNIFKPYKI